MDGREGGREGGRRGERRLQENICRTRMKCHGRVTIEKHPKT
jgi:hypothetical protein